MVSMERLILARDAHQMSIDNNEQVYKKQMEYLIKNIQSAIDKGNFSITYHDDLNVNVIDTLKKCGYTIHTYPLHDDDYYEISW